MSVVASLLNDDCSSLTPWSINEAEGATVAVSPAGQFYYSGGGSGTARANIEQTLVTANNFTIEFRAAKNVIGSDEYNAIVLEIGTTVSNTKLQLYIDDVGLFVYNGASYVEVGTNVVPNNTSFHTYRFEVTGGTPASATVNCYIDNSLVGSGDEDCSFENDTARIPFIQVRSYSTACAVHFDWIKIGNGLGEFADAGGAFLNNFI